MTRDSLRPLEGRLVWFCGRMDTWRPMADGRLTACMVNVTIRPWDGEAPVRDCPVAAVIDHAWIGNIPTSQPRERLLAYEGIARIGWYRRADGTVDLGLQKVPALDLSSAVLRLQAVDCLTTRLTSLQALLDIAERENGVFYAWALTRTAALASLRHVRDRMEASEAATARALVTATRNGRCRGLDLVPLRRRKPQARTIAGFA